MKHRDWVTIKLNYYAHRHPEALRACRAVLNTIAKSNQQFRNHERLVYWLSKPNGKDEWCDLMQNMLVICFLHEYCDLLPMTPSEDAFDTSGEPVIYEEVLSGIFWKRSAAIWLHDGDEAKEAYQLWPEHTVNGKIVWEPTHEFETYSHVNGYWEAFGDVVPEEASGGEGLSLEAWQDWILA